MNRNIRDISMKLSSWRKDPAWKQETRPVVFILGDELRKKIFLLVHKYGTISRTNTSTSSFKTKKRRFGTVLNLS